MQRIRAVHLLGRSAGLGRSPLRWGSVPRWRVCRQWPAPLRMTPNPQPGRRNRLLATQRIRRRRAPMTIRRRLLRETPLGRMMPTTPSPLPTTRSPLTPMRTRPAKKPTLATTGNPGPRPGRPPLSPRSGNPAKYPRQRHLPARPRPETRHRAPPSRRRQKPPLKLFRQLRLPPSPKSPACRSKRGSRQHHWPLSRRRR